MTHVQIDPTTEAQTLAARMAPYETLHRCTSCDRHVLVMHANHHQPGVPVANPGLFRCLSCIPLRSSYR